MYIAIWDLLALAFAILGVVIIVTQVFIPLASGKPIFPMLLKDRKALEKQLEEANFELDNAALKSEIRNKRERVKNS